MRSTRISGLFLATTLITSGCVQRSNRDLCKNLVRFYGKAPLEERMAMAAPLCDTISEDYSNALTCIAAGDHLNPLMRCNIFVESGRRNVRILF